MYRYIELRTYRNTGEYTYHVRVRHLQRYETYHGTVRGGGAISGTGMLYNVSVLVRGGQHMEKNDTAAAAA